jgi:hypothetical protein
MVAPSALTPTAGAFNISVDTASSRHAIPTTGSPTILSLTNLSAGNGALIYVALGDSSVSSVTEQDLAISPGQTVFVIIGTNTNIAAIATIANSPLNVAPGILFDGSSDAPITGVSMPEGGAGVIGWLSAIWARLASLFGTGIGTATKGVAITPGTPFTLCRAVNVETAGHGTVTWADATTSPYYFTQGSNALAITNVAASGLTAATLVALY